MEEIIAGTTLSKGGVYHYYNSVWDIFKDIMLFGIDYRSNIIKRHLVEYKKGDKIDFITEEIVNKMLDNNPYMPLYVELLRNKKRNQKLKELMEELQSKAKERIKELFDISIDNFTESSDYLFLTYFIDSIIMSSNLLEANECFREKKELLKKMVKLIIENGKE